MSIISRKDAKAQRKILNRLRLCAKQKKELHGLYRQALINLDLAENDKHTLRLRFPVRGSSLLLIGCSSHSSRASPHPNPLLKRALFPPKRWWLSISIGVN